METNSTQEIIMLGTGNALVTKCFNTCFTLHVGNEHLLVDGGGGNGVLVQIEKANIPYQAIHNIFITHAHTDHIMGIVWILRKISPMMNHGTYEGDLHVYCHDEVMHALRTICDLLIPAKIRRDFDKRILFHEVKDGDSTEMMGMKMEFFDIGSTKTKQFGFKALLPDGQTLVCAGDEPAKEVAFDRIMGCDWLMHEAFCLYKDRLTFRPYEKHHSTALDTGRVAADLKAKNLIIYHTEDRNLDIRKTAYAKEAAISFANPIFVPDDLEHISLSKK